MIEKCVILMLALCPMLGAAADWNVADAGAKGDGVTDNTAAFQRMLDAAGEAGGGLVHVPAGKYRIDGTLTIPRAVTLEGVFNAPPTDRGGRPLQLDGTVLLAYANRGNPDGPPFIKLGGEMAVLRGVIIHYPEWRQEDVPPVPYPPAIGAEHVNDVAVLDCLIENAYEGIHFEWTARFVVRNVFGYPSLRGLYVDTCYDIGRVENCHFWPFGVAYNPKDPYCLWVNTNGVAFEFARTDWQYVINTFCFGYGVGYKFSKYEHGPCNGNFLGLGADSCRRAVLVEDCQGPGLLITNGEFVGRWSSVDSVCVEIAPEASGGKVSLTNCSFWGPIDRCVWLRTPHTQFTANACHFLNFDNNATGAPAIQLDTGKAILQGNTFGGGDVHVVVGEDVRSAIIMGNQAPTGLAVANHAGDRTQLVANEKSPVQWTDAALCHYRIDVGQTGDAPYVRGWHGREKAAEWPDGLGGKRWSSAESELRLPVAPNARYTITLDVRIPEHAIAPEAGLYLGDECIAAFPDTPGGAEITVELPRTDKDKLRLFVRAKGWVPADLNPESKDRRTLGLALRTVIMQAPCASAARFNANTGDWLGVPPSAPNHAAPQRRWAPGRPRSL